MKLTFLYLRIGRFKAFTSESLLEFDVRGTGLHFVRGENLVEPRLSPNGAAKSTVWDALSWCLYGRTVQGLQGPDVLPLKGGGVDVSVGFALDKREHEVTRTLKPNLLTIGDSEANQEQVNKLIGMDYGTFLQTVVLGQGKPLFFDLQPREKMDLLSAVLRLDKWEDRSKLAGERARKIENKMLAIEGEVAAYTVQEENLRSLVRDAKGKATTWEADRQKRLSAAEKALREYEKTLDRAEVEAGKHDLKLDGSATEAKQLEHDLERFVEEVDRAQTKVSNAGAKVVELERRQEAAKEELASLGEGSTCPTCGQSLKGTDLARHRKTIKLEIAELQTEINKGIPKGLEDRVSAARKKTAMAARHLQKFRNQESESRDALDRAYRKVADLKATCKIARSTVDALRLENNPHADQARVLNRQIRDVVINRDDAKDELAGLVLRYERTKYWVKGFKDVRLYLLEDFLDELELATNELIEELGLERWQVHYTIEGETKSGKLKRGLITEIYDRDGTARRWEGFSGGEGQRLRLISGLALAEVLLRHSGLRTNLEVLDEPTRGLSARGVRDLCDALAERARIQRKAVYLVDHHAVESSLFDSVLTVQRSAKGAKIV